MKKLLLLLILLIPAVAIAAQEATITAISGKVEVLAPGRDWTPATVGMVLARSAVVSTGFNSSATLESELSTLEVRPLTRVRINGERGIRTTAKIYLVLIEFHAVLAIGAG